MVTYQTDKGDMTIYCKVRTTDGTTDLHSSEGGDLCELVGTTTIGRQIWRWTGSSTSEPQPVEIIFTNHDLLTGIMSFDNGGYYNYTNHLYNAGQTTGIQAVDSWHGTMDSGWYDLSGRKFLGKPGTKGVYIHNGEKIVIK